MIVAYTEREDQLIRACYAAYPPPQAFPPEALSDLAGLLGRPRRSVVERASRLGLTRKRGPARRLTERPCEDCGASFLPPEADRRFCSPACADRRRWQRNPHPRGAAGYTFTDEQRRAVGEASRRTWAGLTDEERALRLLPMQEGSARRLREGPDDKQFTRARGGRRVDLDDRYFRSAWEANYARFLNWMIAQASDVVAWEYEPQTFEFPVKRGTRFYTPDFRVHRTDGSFEWHEVKGWMTPKGATALRRFALHYPAESAKLKIIDEVAYRALHRDVARLVPGWE